MRAAKARARLTVALRLAGPDGATALDLIDATGVHSGDLYRLLADMRGDGLVTTVTQPDGRTRFRVTAAGIRRLDVHQVARAYGVPPHIIAPDVDPPLGVVLRRFARHAFVGAALTVLIGAVCWVVARMADHLGGRPLVDLIACAVLIGGGIALTISSIQKDH